MAMITVNKPEKSRAIVGLYLATIVFLSVLGIFFLYASLYTPMGSQGLWALIAVLLVEGVMIILLTSIYRTRYIITEDRLIIKTSRLIGGSKEILLKGIESVEGSLIPFGIRLFGASFHGGYYYIPSIGRAFVAITNFKDGLLVKTREGNYLITPKDPEEFKKALEARKGDLST
jgi:hypothetical protein